MIRRHKRMIRHVDYRAMAVRHCDGVREIAAKIKEKASELINQFKELSAGRKIVYLLSQLMKIISAISVAKDVYGIKKDLSALNAWKEQYISETKAFMEKNAKLFGGGSVAEEEITGYQNTFKQKKKFILIKHGLKILLGLVGAFAGYATESLAKSAPNNELERR